MANLANIIKNINPPIDLTQSEYNSLSTEQKNGGNIFYVEDGSGKKQVAATTSTEESNIQKELDDIGNTLDHVISGPLSVYQAQYLISPREQQKDGFQIKDSYGNFYGRETATTNDGYWGVYHFNNSHSNKTGRPFCVHLNSGTIESKVNGKNTILVYGQGTTFSKQYKNAGFIHGSGKMLRVQIPIHHCATAATITNLNLLAIQYEGGYPYMKYGTNAASSLQLNSSRNIWKNSAQVYANSISSIETTLRNNGTIVQIIISFVNSLTVSATGANLTNFTPIGVIITPTIVFS